LKLYPHQVQALEKTKSFNHVAYYLDMGLGKTFIGSEKLKELNTNHNLIVCQKSKLDDWYEHMKTFYPDYNTIIYNKPHTIPDHSIVIINYDLVWRRKELLTTLRNFTLMLDESSMIKNEKSNRSKFILKMKPINVILLSGTPTGGKYEQLWSQLKLLGWNISKRLYWDEFIKFVKIDVGGFPIKKVTGYKNVDRLKDKLRTHGAIFMKSDEVFQLPEQIEQTIKVNNTKEYTKFKHDRLIKINDVELVGDTSLTKMLYLRQLSSQYNSNKTAALNDLLESTNDRVIVFYNFDKELEIIKEICNKLEKPISIINGHEKNLTNFNECHDCVLLGQYQAAAMGLNLQLSNKIIYFSLPLQSELFEQSKKRIHRIGQDRSCFYYYLITKNSIEEQIFEILKQRRDYTNKLFEESDL
jgi:SNF2 family DNA or RNA helicase